MKRITAPAISLNLGFIALLGILILTGAAPHDATAVQNRRYTQYDGNWERDKQADTFDFSNASQNLTIPDPGLEEAINISDPGLEEAIRDALGIDEPEAITIDLAYNLTYLAAPSKGIKRLDGLEYFTNLAWLDLSNNLISDANALVSLDNLTWLDLRNNLITDISELSQLRNLTWLDLAGNLVDTVSDWAGDSTDYSQSRLDARLDFLNTTIDRFQNLADQWSLRGNIWNSGLTEAINSAPPFLELLSELTWPRLQTNFMGNLADWTDLISTRIDLWNDLINDLSNLSETDNLPWLAYRLEALNNLNEFFDRTQPNINLWYNFINDIDALIDHSRSRADRWSNFLADLSERSRVNNQTRVNRTGLTSRE